jgi:hypothetical protein
MNPDAKALCDSYHIQSAEDKAKILAGFAYIMSIIDIDTLMLRQPFLTNKKQEIQDNCAPAVEDWFKQTDSDWEVGLELSATEAFKRFESWAERHDRNAYYAIKNAKSFGWKLKWLLDQGYLTKRPITKGHMYTKNRYFDPESEQEAKERLRKEAATRQMKVAVADINATGGNDYREIMGIPY